MQDVAIDAIIKSFLLMIIFNMVMFVSSIIQMILGKGRRITPPRIIKDVNQLGTLQVIHCNVPSLYIKI